MNPKLKLLILSALSVSALNVLAQNLVVTSDTTVSGTHYENPVTSYAALTNSSTWTFTGSDVTLTGTAASGNGRLGVNFTGGGKLDLTDSAINANLYGIQLTNTSAATLANVVINSGSLNNGYGVTLTTSSTLTMTGGTITTGTTNAYGINATNASRVTLQDGTVIRSYSHGINLSGTSVLEPYHADIITQNGYGLYLTTSSTATVIGGTITTGAAGVGASSRSQVNLQDVTIKSYGVGINITGTSTATLNNISVTSQNNGISATALSKVSGSNWAIELSADGTRGVAAGGTATIIASDIRVTNSGSRAYGIFANGGGRFDLTNVQVSMSGSLGSGVVLDGYDTSGTISHGTVTTSGFMGHGVYLSYNHSTELYLLDVNVVATGERAHGIKMNSTTSAFHTLVIDGGSITSQQANALSVNDDSVDIGDAEVLVTRSGTYDVTIRGGATLNGADAAIAINKVTGTDSSGNLVEVVDKETSVVIRVEEQATINGNLTVAGGTNTNVDVSLSDSTLTGNTNANDDSTLNFTGSNGSTISGNVTGNGNATIDVTISDPGSSLTGDIAQNDDATVTITLDNHSTGTGGFNGGNLITGGDSAWTFDKDSHGNYGENNGTWNIGDYEVIFDNMTHTGTVNINVNSDTGAGGSITV
ncbi:MAG: right-handed parallel beta-helix repeat-containing protein, partial [Verrucomicrobiales bacterium]|nr:right-handed parallel beta-helix repeat-containing protein [Verrucomicrobiales bacterium]